VRTIYKIEIVGFAKRISEKNSLYAQCTPHLTELLNFCNWKKCIFHTAIEIERRKKASRELPYRSAFRRVLRPRSPVFFAYSISSGARSGAHCTCLEKYYYACALLRSPTIGYTRGAIYVVSRIHYSDFSSGVERIGTSLLFSFFFLH